MRKLPLRWVATAGYLLLTAIPAAGADTIQITKADWKSFSPAPGFTFYYLELEGTYTSNMIASNVDVTREVNNQTQTIARDTQPVYNAAAMTGTWKAQSMTFAAVPPAMTITARLYRNGVQQATVDKNVTFP